MSSESDEELGESAKGKKKTSEKKESSDSEETTTKNKKKNSKMKDSDSDDDKEKSHKKKKKHTKKESESDSDDDIEETTKKKKKTPQHKKRPRKLPEFSDKVVPRIVLLGATGAGKSHLGNTLLGEKRFIVSDNPESCTSEASEIVRGFWLGDGPEFEIIDTPGLNDSEGRDTEHIQNIVENLRDNKFVNMFLIVRNGHDLRMANSYSDMLRMFEMIFGDTFWKHAMFDVSGNLGKAKKSAARKWIRALRDSFPNARTVKSVFLDVEEEDEDFNSNVDTLWQSCSTFPKFACKDIKVVLAEKDRLEAEKEQLAAENEENAKKLKALKKAKSQEQEEYEEKLREAKIQADKAIEEERKLAEREKREELQKLLDQVKEKESELHKINADKISVVMERDFELKLHKQENLAKEHFEKEKKDLRIHYENLLEEKIREERENEIKKSQNEQGLLDQIRELKKLNEVSGLFANEKMRYDAEKEKMLKEQQKEIEKRDREIDLK